MIVCRGQGCDKKATCKYHNNWINDTKDDDTFLGIIDEEQCRNGNRVVILNSTENGRGKTAETIQSGESCMHE